MIIIELNYLKNLEAVQRHLEAHKRFLKKAYDDGHFIISGPKEPRVGGVIISLFNDIETANRYIKSDPFYQESIASYHFIKFQPSNIKLNNLKVSDFEKSEKINKNTD